MSDPDFSDIDTDGFPDDISCNVYSDDLRDSEGEHSEIEIDMDSSPIKCSSKTPSSIKSSVIQSKPTKTTTSKIINTDTGNTSSTEPNQITKSVIPKKSVISKKSIVKKSITSSNDCDKKETNQPILKEKESKKKVSNKIKKDNVEIKNESNKESATDSKFQFNEETIEYFSKDILGDVKKICVPNSNFNNDTALLCLLLKLEVFKEYKCIEKKCKTGKTWLGHPIQLLIHRKNNKMFDLSTNNLELICANCYIAKYGLDLFVKVISKTIYKCTYCDYPLSNFTNSKKKERICMSCESKIMTSGYFDQRSKFIDQLSDTIDDASTLKKDEFKSSNYYSQVSQFKSFDSTNNGEFKSAPKNTKSEISTKTFNNKPIIQLNLNVPNLDDLISEN